MPPPLPKVFLSSTIYDLRDLRDAVQTALRKEGYPVLASEDGSIPVDSSKHSYEVCLEAARNCDCLVAVIDGRFGGTMPDGKTSITQAEVEVALGRGRQVYVFVRQGVWDAKEIYTAHAKAGHPFVASKVVDDERVFDVIDAIRKRATGNWIFQFNKPSDLIETVFFQLQSYQASKTAASSTVRLKDAAEFQMVRIKDMSTPTAKRYSAFLIVGNDVERAAVHQLVAKATEQLKVESYQRPGPMRELWADKPAHVIWTYVGGSMEDIDQGNWVCRSLWVDPNVEQALSIHPLGGDERVNGIEFIWNHDYDAHKKFVAAHRTSKGEVLGSVEQLANSLLRFADFAKDKFAKFTQNAMSETHLAGLLQADCDEVRELYQACSYIPPGPPDTHEAVEMCGLLGGSVDELFDSYSVRWMKERTATQRRIRFETAMSTLQGDLRKWEVACEKVHHG
jgi:hypothetical protein